MSKQQARDGVEKRKLMKKPVHKKVLYTEGEGKIILVTGYHDHLGIILVIELI